MDGLNEWNLCECLPTKKHDVEEVNEVFQNALTYKSNLVMEQLKVGMFGAIGCDDPAEGFFLSQWKSKPYTVQEKPKVFGGITVPTGSVVVEAQIYNSIPHNPGWFEPPAWTPGMAYDLVWIQHVVRAVVPSMKSKQVG